MAHTCFTFVGKGMMLPADDLLEELRHAGTTYMMVHGWMLKCLNRNV